MIITAGEGDTGKRLDAFLHEQLPEFSRSRLQSWIKEQRVRIDGKPARASHLLKSGEAAEVSPANREPLKAEAEELPLEVLYEDRDVIVVNKAAGMVVHAGAGHSGGTLVNALLHRFGPLSSINGELRPGIVHRLDRDTSGVLAVARTDKAHQSLAKQFQDRTVEKSYLAVVHGRMKGTQGRDWDSDCARSGSAHPHDNEAWLRALGVDGVRGFRGIRAHDLSGGADRNRPHASDSGASGEHRPSGFWRQTVWGAAIAFRTFLSARTPAAIPLAFEG